MDAERFDTLLRSLSGTASRRSAMRLLAGSALGSLLTLGSKSAEAKKGKGKGRGKGKGKRKKQVTICHDGQTIRVAKSALKGHRKHGDRVGECPPGQGICTAQMDICVSGDISSTRCHDQSATSSCVCFQTPQGDPFCGAAGTANVACTEDSTCEEEMGPGARCIQGGGFCFPGMICAAACPNPA